VIAGMELGLGPMASLTGIHLVQGKITLSANLIAAQVARSEKYKFRVVQMESEVCEIAFFEGREHIGTSTFTKATRPPPAVGQGRTVARTHPEHAVRPRDKQRREVVLPGCFRRPRLHAG